MSDKKQDIDRVMNEVLLILSATFKDLYGRYDCHVVTAAGISMVGDLTAGMRRAGVISPEVAMEYMHAATQIAVFAPGPTMRVDTERQPPPSVQ